MLNEKMNVKYDTNKQRKSKRKSKAFLKKLKSNGVKFVCLIITKLNE